MPKQFRLCAGAIVFNDKGNVFLGNRIETKEDSWQFPQGGIEPDETPEMAAKRELFEETSICSVKPIYTDNKPSRYEFSQEIKEKFRKRGIFNDGQDIYFTLFYFVGKESEINLQTTVPEFKSYVWESFDFAVQNIISFKKEVYLKAKHIFLPKIGQYLDGSLDI